jgi:hypothetical protein
VLNAALKAFLNRDIELLSFKLYYNHPVVRHFDIPTELSSKNLPTYAASVT